MAAAAPRADFKLILISVNPVQVQSVVTELMELFPIDQATALGAVQNAPIILVSGMTPAMAANLRTHITRLAKLGAQLRLTAEPVGKLKQFRWPSPPSATLRPANVFMCPTCGERFVVQRWAPARPAVAPVAEAEPEATPAPEPPAAEAIPEGEVLPADAFEGVPEAEHVPLAADDEGAVPEAEPLEAEERPLASVAEDEPIEDLVEAPQDEPEAEEAEPAAPTRPEPARPAAVESAIPVLRIAGELETRTRPIAAAAPTAALKPRPQPQAPAQAAPAQPKLQPRQLSSVAMKPVAPTPAPAPAAAPEAAGAARYDVSVAKARGSQQEELARLLVARLGLPPEEAEKQCERTVILVCKGGSAAEADEWRRAVEKIGLKPRIRKH